MLSKFKTLLIAGAALPLASGFAFAQTATAPVTNAPVANAPAAATVAPAPTATKTSKDLGALKATPAEKKALHEKASAAAPETKTAAIVKHRAVKKVQTTGAAGKPVDPTMTQKPSDAATPAKKLENQAPSSADKRGRRTSAGVPILFDPGPAVISCQAGNGRQRWTSTRSRSARIRLSTSMS